MRRVLVTLFFCFLPIAGSAQVSPQAAPKLPSEPAAILAAAAPFYDYTSPSLKPWHIKLSYQLSGDDGKPEATGSYEYWWASPGTYRSTWRRPGMEHTDWHVNGEHSSRGSGGPLTIFERKLQSDLLSPLPAISDLDPEQVRLEKRDQEFGKAKLPCVMVIRKTASHGLMQRVPTGLFPTFCFESDKPVLRAYYAFGATSVLYNKIARTQGLYLAQEISIFEGQTRYLTASVDTVNAIAPGSAELTPEADARPEPAPRRVQVLNGLAAGMQIKSVPPIYPEEAKLAHIDGRVRLRAVIGTDGRVHDLKVIDGPAPSLIASAMEAVSQWRYKPYLLNGEPVEVDTTVNVLFDLGAR